jgi:hypothetical protein
MLEEPKELPKKKTKEKKGLKKKKISCKLHICKSSICSAIVLLLDCSAPRDVVSQGSLQINNGLDP